MQMYTLGKELKESIEGAKKIFMVENAKGVEHFQKFEKMIEDLVKVTTRAHDRVDTRAIKNKALRKKVEKLEERCDTLTGQVGVVSKPNLMVSLLTPSSRWPHWSRCVSG